MTLVALRCRANGKAPLLLDSCAVRASDGRTKLDDAMAHHEAVTLEVQAMVDDEVAEAAVAGAGRVRSVIMKEARKLLVAAMRAPGHTFYMYATPCASPTLGYLAL